ncbi:MAG: J domain-containing protein [Gloeomargaritaceae cyanobacterium C42_A2020_066]|nr:J domain-containing protein [Gloeomargaritaceae cyanobacterium C42_A2020_066]
MGQEQQSVGQWSIPLANAPVSHYTILGVATTATPEMIRRAYRDLSKRYHPVTTTLPAGLAREKFQQVHQAYTVLISPQQRTLYDLSLQTTSAPLPRPAEAAAPLPNSSYLDPIDRPLSSGELFALFILGVTLVACLVVAVILGLVREAQPATSLADLMFSPPGVYASALCRYPAV